MLSPRFDIHDFQQQRDQRVAVLARGGSGLGHNGEIMISEETVRRSLNKIDPSKAAGPDNVTPRVSKGCAEQLHKILRHILSYCSRSVQSPARGNVTRSSCAKENKQLPE